jgi:hypothetical protein
MQHDGHAQKEDGHVQDAGASLRRGEGLSMIEHPPRD